MSGGANVKKCTSAMKIYHRQLVCVGFMFLSYDYMGILHEQVLG